MKKVLFILCVVLAIIFTGQISFSAQSSTTQQTKNKEEKKTTIENILKILGGVKSYKHIEPDTLKEIVVKLIEVKNGLSPEQFYRQVSALEMPAGKQLRYVLMQIKSDIGTHLGKQGLEFVFGSSYPEGGSFVEKTLLLQRKKIVQTAIHDAIKQISLTHPAYSAFYSEVGSWSNDNPKQLTFAGDIDFNFLCGDMATAQTLKRAFDESIHQKYGRTPEELDIPCTVHGSATGEVYVGLHGQKFVEGEMKNRAVKKISFGDDGKPAGIVKDSHVEFEDARNIMLLEAELSNTPLPDVEEMKIKTQPGLTLEMIRHFEHDIVKQKSYTELESFIKAAKYLDRHYKSLIEESGEDAVKDKVLRDFSRDLVANKKSPRIQVELITKYFESIHKPLPFEADLALNKTGKNKATIKANNKVIDAFWDQCRKTMWETANNKLQEVTEHLNQRARALGKNSAAEAKALNDEITNYQKMLEVEDRILRHEKVGIAQQLDGRYLKNIENFRSTVKHARQRMVKNRLLKASNPTIQGVYNLAEGLAESDTDTSRRMAAAAWLTANLKSLKNGIDTVNSTLDFIDDGLMDNIRHGPTSDYASLLKNGEDLYWSSQVNQFLDGTGISVEGDYAQKLNKYQVRAQARIAKTSDWMTAKLKNRVVARGAKWLGKKASGVPRSINNTFNQSVSSSGAGQTMMQGMMVYNLSQELPVYWNAMLDNDWEKLGTELFKRRVPFGAAVENYMMGNYYGAAWEVTTTIIPPAALLSVAKSLATELALKGIEVSWSAELDEFIDDLYNDAEFKIVRVETTGDNLKVSEWQLVTVSVDGEKYNYDDTIQLSIDASKEMARCIKRPSRERTTCWPFEKENPLFKGWRRDLAFRENFAKTDPWIQLIEEMEKNKIAGPKLKDYYFYRKQLRYEELRVYFLRHTKEKLEARRAGEQALLSGNLPELYDELLKIADKLEIQEQVKQSIDAQFGGEISQGLTYGKELLIGAIFRGDDDIWDIYRERASAITEALKTYKHIWEGRKEAEQILTLNHRDQGLRILTGPFFLSGSAPDDESSAVKWIILPSQMNDQMVETLNDIKREAEADPAVLDLSDGAYDKSILEQLIYHATFKEMWKHVFGQPAARDVVSSVRSESTENSGQVETEQDHALQRFKLHEKRVEEIINDFRTHYGLEETGELAELNQELEHAVQLAGEICADSTTAMSHIDAIGPLIEAAQQTFYSYEKSIQDAVNTARDLESIENSLVETHQIAEDLAISIGDDAALAGERREVVCQAAAELKVCDSNSARDRLVAEAMTAHVEIKPTFERARKNSLELEGLNGQVKEKLERLTKAQQLAVSIDDLPAELTTARSGVDQNLHSAETLLTAAMEIKLISLSEVSTHAAELATELKKGLKLPEEADLQQRIEEIGGQISAQLTKAEGCLEAPKTQLIAEKAHGEEFLNRYSKLEINVNRIKRAFSVDEEGDEGGEVTPLFASALEKANLTDFLISMGDGYIKNCAEHLIMAKVCMNTVDQLSLVDFSFIMPNIVGLTCQEGQSTVASNQVNFQVVSAGKALHPDWEYCVDSTDPAAGADVPLKDKTVLISCFEELDIPAYLATVDCSFLPGGTAVYDYGQRVGVCDCVDGVVYNTSQTRCIDCEEYHQGMLGAFHAGDLDTAQAWVDESKNCGWVSVAQAQINDERHRRLCAKITGNLEAACRSNNARAANGLLGEASSQQCSVSSQLYQRVASLVNAHNQRVRQQQAQNQRNVQNMLNLIAQGINAAANSGHSNSSQSSSSSGYDADGFGIGYGNGSNGNQNSSHSSGGSSNSGSGNECSKCPGSICIFGVCAKKQ